MLVVLFYLYVSLLNVFCCKWSKHTGNIIVIVSHDRPTIVYFGEGVMAAGRTTN